MRVAVMLRTIDETGGIGVYTRNIVAELLRIAPDDEFLLLYRTDRHLGRYGGFPNATERLLPAANKVLWDQLAVPRAAARAGADVIFHPKFTVPLITRIPTVMVVHGADWFIPPYHRVYNRIDTAYIRVFMPLYLRSAAAVISVSDYSTQGFVARFPWSRSKMRTIYFAPARHFRRIEEPNELRRVRQQYRLPERFLLSVLRYDGGRKKLRKNFGNMARGFALAWQRYRLPHAWVVAGRACDRFARDYDLKALGIADVVHFPGLIDQADLPAFYSLADLYLYPTIIEAFPIPITEAMACGCPIVTSHDTGLAEISADAAVHVDPQDPEQIAEAIGRALQDASLRERLRDAGLRRARAFSWERCAHQTLEVLREAAR